MAMQPRQVDGAVAAALGGPMVILVIAAGWMWIGMVLLLWNAKNFEQESSKWITRIIIVLILLSMVGVGMKG